MTTFTASARQIDGALRHEIDVNGRHTIYTDEPAGLGGDDTAPTPHELIAAAAAACVSTMVALYARRHEWQIEDLGVDAVYDADAIPRKLSLVVHLPADLDEEQVSRLRRVAETCPVVRALEFGFTVDESVVVEGLASTVRGG